MKFALSVVILLCPAVSGAQVTEAWVNRYHGPVDGSGDAAAAIALDSAGNVYVTGSSQGNGTSADFATVAYDSSGNQLWEARYNGPANGSDNPSGIAVDSSTGNVYVTGRSQGAGTGYDYATVAYDSSGNQLWVARYNGPGNGDDFSNGIAVDSNTGNVYVTGQSQGLTNIASATVAYDSSGNQLWVARYSAPSNSRSVGTAIAVDVTSGDVYVTGYHYDNHGLGPFSATVAYDNAGTQLWVQEWPYAGNPSASVAIALGPTGNIYVTGWQDRFGLQYLTIAYDPNGARRWFKYSSVAGSGAGRGTAIAVDARTENVYVTGGPDGCTGFACTYNGYGTVAYDSSGNELWENTYSARNGHDVANGVAVDSNTGNVYVTGQGQGPTNIASATVAYDSSGNQLWVARGPSNGPNVSNAIAVDSNTGNIYVTGNSAGATGSDYLTVAYSAGQPVVNITEYGVPTPASNPEGITTGPDGAIWFAEYSSNKIGRITTAGVVVEYPIPNVIALSDITTGPDGALWFTGWPATIGRITTGGVVTEYTTPTADSIPFSITTGPDGALWFTEYGANKIGRITTSGTMTEFPIPTASSNPDGIASAVGGRPFLWFTENSGNKIGTILLGGQITEYPVLTPNAGLRKIARGPDGAFWFTEQYGNKIGRITTSGSVGEYTLPTGGSYPSGITAGPNGAMWFTEQAQGIGQITANGTITEYMTPSLTGSGSIAWGPDDALSFSESASNQIGQAALQLLVTSPAKAGVHR